MPHPTILVKVSLQVALRHSSLRSLFTLAHYFGLPLAARWHKTTVATFVHTHLHTPSAREHLRQSLTANDTALVWQVLAARDVVLPPTVRVPWRLAAPWPSLADLHPLERVMALGCLVPVRSTRGIRVLVPDLLLTYLAPADSPALPALPPSPPLTGLLADACVILGSHAANTVPPNAVLRHPAQAAALRAALHNAGLLPDHGTQPAVAVWVGMDATRQRSRLLDWWLHMPTGDPRLDGWRTAILGWVRETVARYDATQWSLARLREAAEAASAFAQLPRSERQSVVAAWLVPLLRDAGLLRSDGVIAHLTADGLAWAHNQPVPVPTPRLPTLGITTSLPTEAPAIIHWMVPQWAEPHGARWRFTTTSLRRGCDQWGSTQPLRRVAQDHALVFSPALTTLLSAVDRPPSVRLVTRTMLESSDSTVLDGVLADGRLARLLGSRRSATSITVPPSALARVVGHGRRHGWLAAATPPPAPPPQSAILHALALRIAATTTPAYADQFTTLARNAARALSPSDQTDLDDQWAALTAPTTFDTTLEPLAASAPPPTSTVDRAELLAAIQGCIIAITTLSLRYYTPTTHAITTRIIRPLALTPPYLRAFCHRAQDERTFHLDRILAIDNPA